MSVDPIFENAIPKAAVMLLGMSCGMLSTWLFHLIRTEVNARLPESQRVGPLGATPFLFGRVLKAHREMYPESNLRVVMNAIVVVGLISAVVFAFLIGALGPLP
jgi:formate hydrogenlyase subunit 4